jgi:hypothetical protein
LKTVRDAGEGVLIVDYVYETKKWVVEEGV